MPLDPLQDELQKSLGLSPRIASVGNPHFFRRLNRALQRAGSRVQINVLDHNAHQWQLYRRVARGTPRKLAARHIRGADLVLIWNGLKGIGAEAREVLGPLQRHVILESGPLPQTVQIDRVGVNFGSERLQNISLAEIDSVPLEDGDVQRFRDLALQTRPLRGGVRLPPQAQALPERFVLFIAQVHDDSQITVYSPRFASVEEAVRFTHAEIEEHNRRTGDRLRLVVKEHPSEFGRKSYADLRRALADALFFVEADNSELATRSAAVVTINSSLGLQCLSLNKPVVTLGKAFYALPGIGHSLLEGSLADLLPAVLGGQGLDPERQIRFLKLLWTRYLVPLRLKQPEPDHAVRLMREVLSLARALPESRSPWVPAARPVAS